MEIVVQPHAKSLKALGERRADVLVLSADLTSSCEADYFKGTFPERFISCGIAEQNMLSIAGGLAREGFIPLVHTFAVFIYRRALDQIAMSVAYPNLPVKMLGFLPGVTTPGGATHQAIDDVAVMRALPNMTVLEVGDATEVESVLDLACEMPGPVYVRMLRGEVPRLFDRAEPMRLDTPRVLASGSDLLVVSAGICTEEAMRAVSVLTEHGVSVAHVHVSTYKPFASPVLPILLAQPKHGIISVENHTTVGGLGTVLSEMMVRNRIARPLVTLGLADTFAHGASRRFLMREHGLDAKAITAAAEQLIGTQLGLVDSDFSTVRIEAVHSNARAEAM